MSQFLISWVGLTASMAVVTLCAVWSRSGEMARLLSVACFALSAMASHVLLQQTLGFPDHDTLPPGEYKVLGARIDVDVAIYAMLDDGSGEPPHLYRLPYTTGQANALQDALDATAGGQAGGTGLQQSDSPGEPQFYPIPVQPNPPKAGESPMVEMP